MFVFGIVYIYICVGWYSTTTLPPAAETANLNQVQPCVINQHLFSVYDLKSINVNKINQCASVTVFTCVTATMIVDITEMVERF